MTPEQEINRIKREYGEHWARMERYPQVQKAIADKNPIKLGEVLARLVYGDRAPLSKEQIESGREEIEYHERFKERQKLIDERKKSSN